MKDITEINENSLISKKFTQTKSEANPEFNSKKVQAIKYQLQTLFYSPTQQNEILQSKLGPGTYDNPKAIGGSEYLNRSPKFKFN